jgi:hypothetical protein
MVDFNPNQQHEETATRGSRMSEFRDSEGYREFKALILDAIREEAFEIFDTVEASDQVGIVGAQQMKKVVDRIESKIDGFIQEGRLAVDYLNNSNQ